MCARRSGATGVTSAAVPVRDQHCSKLSRGMIARSMISWPRSRAQVDHGAPGDAVEEAVGIGRVHAPSVTKKILAPVASATGRANRASSRRCSPPCLGGVLGQRADHVEPGALACTGAFPATGAATARSAADALHARSGRNRPAIPRPRSRGGSVLLGRDPHHLAAAPGDGADIGVGDAVAAPASRQAWSISSTVGDLEIQDLGERIRRSECWSARRSRRHRRARPRTREA